MPFVRSEFSERSFKSLFRHPCRAVEEDAVLFRLNIDEEPFSLRREFPFVHNRVPFEAFFGALIPIDQPKPLHVNPSDRAAAIWRLLKPNAFVIPRLTDAPVGPSVPSLQRRAYAKSRRELQRREL